MNYGEIQKLARKLTFDVARQRIPEYEYALVYGISGIFLGRTSELAEIDWEECSEARFFSRDKELHFFGEEGGLQAVEVLDDGQGNVDRLEKKYQLGKTFTGIGKLLCVYEYLVYDEDGQATVGLTRLAGIEEV